MNGQRLLEIIDAVGAQASERFDGAVVAIDFVDTNMIAPADGVFALRGSRLELLAVVWVDDGGYESHVQADKVFRLWRDPKAAE